MSIPSIMYPIYFDTIEENRPETSDFFHMNEVCHSYASTTETKISNPNSEDYKTSAFLISNKYLTL